MVLSWVDIISCKDFNCYLIQSEIAKVSSLSKLWRKKLAPVVFTKVSHEGFLKSIVDNFVDGDSYNLTKHDYTKMVHLISNDEINILSYAQECEQSQLKYAEDCDCVEDFKGICQHSCQKKSLKVAEIIKANYKQIQSYVIHLKAYGNVNSFPYQDNYILSYIECLYNLQCLDLGCGIYNLDQLNNIFSKFAKLESLKLDKIEIVCELDWNTRIVDINFPKSIKNLYIDKGKTNQLEYIDDGNMDLDELVDLEYYFCFKPQYLPNLKKLTYINEIDYFDIVMTEFLILNPQLDYLSSSENAFSITLLNQISSQPYIKRIEIIQEENHCPEEFDINPSHLSSIERLSISVADSHGINFSKKFILACINIRHLSLKFYKYRDDLGVDLSKSIDKLVKLRVLTIYNYKRSINFILNILKGSTIHSLNLIDYGESNLDLSLFEQSSNIKCVKLFGLSRRHKVKLGESITLQRNPNWRVLVFHTSISCYKITA